MVLSASLVPGKASPPLTRSAQKMVGKPPLPAASPALGSFFRDQVAANTAAPGFCTGPEEDGLVVTQE